MLLLDEILQGLVLHARLPSRPPVHHHQARMSVSSMPDNTFSLSIAEARTEQACTHQAIEDDRGMEWETMLVTGSMWRWKQER